ncbi:hypothetical protein LCGC14_2550360 [marine sediment metagenome]|uniref:Uncharacterized protein n=1 Tax=marine sediment metagenome TaxID=412755 RepID=A0A0F9BAY1_9ZZZZ
MERFEKTCNVKQDDKSLSFEMNLDSDKSIIFKLVTIQSCFLSSEPSLDISLNFGTYNTPAYNFKKPMTKRIKITIELLE